MFSKYLNHICLYVVVFPLAISFQICIVNSRNLCGLKQSGNMGLQIQCNPHQNSNSIFHRVRKSNLQIHLEELKNKDSKNIVNNKRTSGGITIPDLKLYYRAIVITTWYWYSDRQVDQWNIIEDPEMNPHTYGHLIFGKGTKAIQWKKDSIFNKWCWHNWQLACRRRQINTFLSLCTKLKSKYVKDLHINPETLN